MTELGGDPACWAHLWEGGEDADTDPPRGVLPLVADLARSPAEGDGAVWSLPHGGDLDANLVRLGPGGEIGEHRNTEVDVLIVVRTGGGALHIDGVRHRLDGDRIALIPRGVRRSILAGPAGISYLSVHRRRGPLTIGTGPTQDPGHERKQGT